MHAQQLFEYVGRGRALLPAGRQSQLVKQDFAQLFRRVDVEGLSGGRVNGVGQRVQAGLSLPGNIVERLGINPDAFLFHLIQHGG